MNKEQTVKIKFNIMAIALIIIFCFAISPVTLQNDTFYTIAIGDQIVHNGIDMKDHWSWIKDLSYTYPHWAYDVMMYTIYNLSGQVGIYISTIVLTSMLGLAIYLTNSKLIKNRVISFVLTIGAVYLLKDFITARAQLFTFILFVLTVYFIEMFLETRKKRYAAGLIIIPILIANFHAAVFPFYFVLYLPYIAEYLVYMIANSGSTWNKIKIKIYTKRVSRVGAGLRARPIKDVDYLNNKIDKFKERLQVLQERREKIESNPYKIIMKKNNNAKWLILIMLICVFTGLLTPIGNTPYTYLLNTMLGNTTQNINEHLPLILMNNMHFIIVLIMFFAILMFTDTKIKLSDLFMLGGLIFLTFYSKREESMFIIIGVLILNRLIKSMLDKYDPNGCERMENLMTRIAGQFVTIAIILGIALRIYNPKMGDQYINSNTYPVEAANYILDNPDKFNLQTMHLYNEYNYGSYLLFRGIPVFIDSRADLYTPQFNKNVYAFDDFLSISGLGITNIEQKFNQYGITDLIMYNNAKLKTYIDLKPDKYKLLYSDNKFCIYERLQT